MTPRVTFDNVAIGDWAWLDSNYEGNTIVRIIPRASGVRIHSTNELGGGQRQLIIHAYVIKVTRTELETYMAGLHTSLSKSPKTLVVAGVSYNNCSLTRIGGDGGNERWATFTVEFVQSV